jgi:hypothetical protein
MWQLLWKPVWLGWHSRTTRFPLKTSIYYDISVLSAMLLLLAFRLLISFFARLLPSAIWGSDKGYSLELV